MKRQRASIVVYFATADWRNRHRSLPLRRRLRILRRHPRRVYWWFLAWLVRRITRFPYAHVCVGDEHVVLDPGMKGDRWWARHEFEWFYPTLACRFVIESERPVDVIGHRDTGPKRAWPTVLRWWTRGLWPTNDCVAVTVRLLRGAGLDVPPRTYSPRQLYEWLYERNTPQYPEPRYPRPQSRANLAAGPDSGASHRPRQVRP